MCPVTHEVHLYHACSNLQTGLKPPRWQAGWGGVGRQHRILSTQHGRIQNCNATKIMHCSAVRKKWNLTNRNIDFQKGCTRGCVYTRLVSLRPGVDCAIHLIDLFFSITDNRLEYVTSGTLSSLPCRVFFCSGVENSWSQVNSSHSHKGKVFKQSVCFHSNYNNSQKMTNSSLEINYWTYFIERAKCL